MFLVFLLVVPDKSILNNVLDFIKSTEKNNQEIKKIHTQISTSSGTPSVLGALSVLGTLSDDFIKEDEKQQIETQIEISNISEAELKKVMIESLIDKKK